MANITFSASWDAVPTAESYRVVVKVNGAEVYAIQGGMLVMSRTLDVQDGDVVSVEVVASNVGGDSPAGIATLTASVVSAPNAPVVYLTQL